MVLFGKIASARDQVSEVLLCPNRVDHGDIKYGDLHVMERFKAKYPLRC
jgi:hypothetical protein